MTEGRGEGGGKRRPIERWPARKRASNRRERRRARQWGRAAGSGAGGRECASPVKHPPGEDADLERGDREDDKEEDDRDRGCVAGVEESEGLYIKVVADRLGSLVRAAATCGRAAHAAREDQDRLDHLE